MLLRLLQGRPILHRVAGRSLLIGDVPWVAQSLEATHPNASPSPNPNPNPGPNRNLILATKRVLASGHTSTLAAWRSLEFGGLG